MSLENFIPRIWSARILQNLHKAHVLAEVANTDYEGEISNYGDTVKINAIGPVTVRDYEKGDHDIELDELDDAQTILTIDQAKYFNFSIDDVDAAQQRPKVMDEAMREAAYALSDQADQFLAQFAKEADEILNEGESKAEDVYPALVKINQKLDENNVPRGDRWMVVAPWFMGKMVLAKIFEQQGSFAADDIEAEGYVGQALGLNIYMSNNLIDDYSSEDSLMPAGTRRAISFAEQIISTEAYRPEKSFADAVKGLYVYGGKVVDPQSMVTLRARYEAEGD